VYLVHAQVFFHEDILDRSWIFVIHYDPRLRHVFHEASMNTDKNNDGQQNIDEGLGSREEMEIHDDVEDEYVEAQECEVDNNNQ